MVTRPMLVFWLKAENLKQEVESQASLLTTLIGQICTGNLTLWDVDHNGFLHRGSPIYDFVLNIL